MTIIRGCGALVTIHPAQTGGRRGQAGGQVVAQFPTHTNAVGGPPAAPRSPPPSAAGCALGARRRGTRTEVYKSSWTQVP